MPSKLDQQTMRPFILLVKVAVLITIFLLLYFKFEDNEDLFLTIYSEVKLSFKQDFSLYVLVILLMFFNWSMEAIKWRYLIRSIFPITFWQSFRGVISGLTLSFATPHGLGDYMGRVLSIHQTKKEPLIGALFLGRTSQLLATLLFGMVGLSTLLGPVWIFYILIFKL